MSERKERVRWTEEEWDAVAKAVFQLRQTNVFASVMELATQAQDVLEFPAHKRRVLTSRILCEPLAQRLEQLQASADSRAAEAAEAIEKLQKLQKELSERPTTIQDMMASLTLADLPPSKLDEFLDSISPSKMRARFTVDERLADATPEEAMFVAFAKLSSSLRDVVVRLDHIDAVLAGFGRTPVVQTANVPAVEKKPLPRVALIVGVRDSQSSSLHENPRIKDKAVWLVSAIERGDQVASFPTSVDLVFYWAGLQHISSNMLRKCARRATSPLTGGRPKVVKLRNGVNNMLDTIATELARLALRR